MTRETLIRTILAGLALLNAVLVMLGKAPLDLDENTIYVVGSGIASIVTTFWAWWKNNSITPEAIVADELMHEMKSGRAAACRGDGDVE